MWGAGEARRRRGRRRQVCLRQVWRQVRSGRGGVWVGEEEERGWCVGGEEVGRRGGEEEAGGRGEEVRSGVRVGMERDTDARHGVCVCVCVCGV